MVSENEIAALDTPIGRAEKMAKLTTLGRTPSQIAVVFGCTKATVESTLRLLDCTKPVQNAVADGLINVGHAQKLADLPAAEQKAKLSELIAAGAGEKGHKKAKAQRTVVAGEQPTKMRTRKQITAEIETCKDAARIAVLQWVLDASL